MSDWKSALETEFKLAEAARSHGNEGQARVCARRAAGIAAREFLAHRGQIFRSPSAVELLKLLAKDIHLSAELRQAAYYLTLQVNEQFKLPVEVDLVAEARKLTAGLLE
jgi:hypothetical protein